MASCGDNGKDDPQQSNGASIVGKWVDGEDTITFGSNGSYREDGSLGQYRIGTYSYNPVSSLLGPAISADSDGHEFSVDVHRWRRKGLLHSSIT